VFTSTAESSVVTALQNGDSAALESFLTQNSADFLSFSSNGTTPTSGGILHFSNAVDGGSLTFSATAVGTAPGGGGSDGGSGGTSATPEPSTEFLFAAGFGVLALAGRKFRRS
jgi:hypothetical protein